jgi:hypothetical protein
MIRCRTGLSAQTTQRPLWPTPCDLVGQVIEHRKMLIDEPLPRCILSAHLDDLTERLRVEATRPDLGVQAAGATSSLVAPPDA